jgi:integrase
VRIARGSMRWKGDSLELSIPVPGEKTPGGNQRYHYEYVEVKPGMSREEVERAGQARLAQLQIEIYRGTFVAPSKALTVGKVLDWWVGTWQKGRLEAGEVRQSTVDWDRWLIEHHLKPELGNKPAAKLTAHDIDEAFTRMRKKETSGTTINGAYRTLRKAFNRAVKAKMVPSNPCLSVDAPKFQWAKHSPLTLDEARGLLAAAQRIGRQIYLVILTALLTGMRRGEICGLMWEDLDFERRTVTVRRSVRDAGETSKGKFVINGPKTPNSIRIIKLSETLAEELDKLPRDSPYVFPGPQGPMSPCALTKRDFALARMAANLPKSFRFHDLRHTMATLAHEQGADPLTLADMLGHGDSRSVTERIYIHQSLALQDQIIGVLGKLLKTPEKPSRT